MAEIGGAWLIWQGVREHRGVDGFTPDRFDLAGSAICVVGVAVIVYAPR